MRDRDRRRRSQSPRRPKERPEKPPKERPEKKADDKPAKKDDAKGHMDELRAAARMMGLPRDADGAYDNYRERRQPDSRPADQLHGRYSKQVLKK